MAHFVGIHNLLLCFVMTDTYYSHSRPPPPTLTRPPPPRPQENRYEAIILMWYQCIRPSAPEEKHRSVFGIEPGWVLWDDTVTVLMLMMTTEVTMILKLVITPMWNVDCVFQSLSAPVYHVYCDTIFRKHRGNVIMSQGLLLRWPWTHRITFGRAACARHFNYHGPERATFPAVTLNTPHDLWLPWTRLVTYSSLNRQE